MPAIVLSKTVTPPEGNSPSWKLTLSITATGVTDCPTTLFVFACTRPGVEGSEDGMERLIEIKDLAPYPVGVPVTPVTGGLYYRRSSAVIFFDHSDELDRTFEMIRQDVQTFVAEFTKAQQVVATPSETFTFTV
jgi:hypothetical protein